MNEKHQRLIDQVIFLSCFFYLLVETFHGIILRSNFPISIGQIYKFGLSFLMLIRILQFDKRKFLLLVALIFLLVAHASINFIVHQKISGLFFEIVFGFKVIFIGTAFFYFILILKKYEKKMIYWFPRVILFNFLILVINLVLGILGFGFTQYVGEDVNIGSRGFFFAGNEVSGTMIVLFSIVCFYVWDKYKRFYIPVSLFLLVLSLIKATKVAILGTAIITFLIPFVMERNYILSVTRLKLIIGVLSLVLVPLLVALIYFGLEQTGLIVRLTYFYQNYDLITFLLSSRDVNIVKGMDYYFNEFTFFEQLFGIGSHRLGVLLNGVHSVEVDFFDFLFYYGSIGAISIVLFWLYLIYLAFKKLPCRTCYFAPAVFLSNLLLLFISFTAGHIMYSAMAGMFIGFSNAMAFYKSPQ